MKQNPLNRYAVKMAELNLQRNPTSSEAILMLNDKIRDQYQDAVVIENYRVKKRVVIKKDPSMHYVQFNDTDMLLEDVKNLPWIVSMTVLGVKHYEKDDDGEGVLVDCIPQADDQLLIDGVVYTISQVEPSNRYLDGIVNCTVYPERATQDDPLDIYRIERPMRDTNVISLIYGGRPTRYKLVDRTGTSSVWKEFNSFIKLETGFTGKVVICDKSGKEVIYDI